MQKSKLLILLRSLNREEFRRLGHFVRSPYFNTNDQLIWFYDYLSSFYPGLYSPKLQKEQIFNHLFSAETYDDNRMRQVMFKMTKLLEDFLTTEEVWTIKENQNHLLIQALAKRKLNPYFTKTIQREIKKLEAVECKDLTTFQRLLTYNHQYFFHPDTPKFKNDIQSIRDCMMHLDRYYILAKLQYANEFMARAAALKEEYDIWLLKEIIQRLEEPSSEKKDLLIDLFYHLLLLHHNRSDEELFKFIKAQFIELAAIIPSRERIDLYHQLNNFAISKINEGTRAYMYDFFELINIALNYDILLDRGRITDATFTNVVVISTALKKFEWTHDFISKYEKLLSSQMRESAVQLAWAYWHYNKADFSEVLHCLQLVEFLPSYGFRVKSLRLRTYFELFQEDNSYLEVLLADVHSFELYIQRKKQMNNARKATYLNFIRFTKKLIKLKTDPTRGLDDKKRLKTNIEKKKPLVIKHWLLEKLKEI